MPKKTWVDYYKEQTGSYPKGYKEQKQPDSNLSDVEEAGVRIANQDFMGMPGTEGLTYPRSVIARRDSVTWGIKEKPKSSYEQMMDKLNEQKARLDVQSKSLEISEKKGKTEESGYLSKIDKLSKEIQDIEKAQQATTQEYEYNPEAKGYVKKQFIDTNDSFDPIKDIHKQTLSPEVNASLDRQKQSKYSQLIDYQTKQFYKDFAEAQGQDETKFKNEINKAIQIVKSIAANRDSIAPMVNDPVLKEQTIKNYIDEQLKSNGLNYTYDDINKFGMMLQDYLKVKK